MSWFKIRENVNTPLEGTIETSGPPEKSYPTPVTDHREMAGWMMREENAWQAGYARALEDVVDELSVLEANTREMDFLDHFEWRAILERMMN